MEIYRKAIKENICKICADSNEEGLCQLSENEACALEIFLEKIVEIVRYNDFETINEYYDKLHSTVCIGCRAQNSEGFCYLRKDYNCAIDRYFPRIVEVIKNVKD